MNDQEFDAELHAVVGEMERAAEQVRRVLDRLPVHRSLTVQEHVDLLHAEQLMYELTNSWLDLHNLLKPAVHPGERLHAEGAVPAGAEGSN